MKEQQIQTRWLMFISRRPDVRMFRNNVGTAWTGQVVVSKEPGTIVLQNARPLYAGLCVGSSDLIGWKTVTITPDMVGQQVAVFVAAEVKTATGQLTRDQTNFLDKVRAAGGIAVVVRDEKQKL